MFSKIMELVRKELTRVFTDRRLVFTSFILPGLSIALFYSLMGGLIDKQESQIEEFIPVVYSIEASDTIDAHENALEGRFEFVEKDYSELDGLKEDVRSEDAQLIVVYEANFEEAVESGKPGNVELFYDPSNDQSSEAYYRFKSEFLETYRSEVLAKRLGDASLLEVYTLNNPDEMVISEKGAVVGTGFSRLFPLLISIFIFAGAMGIGMDAVAGEKERGTMSVLLLLPSDRKVIAYGKMISLGIMALISTISSFAGILISMPFSKKIMGLDGDVDVSSFNLSITQYAQLISIMIVTAGIYVGVIILLSVLAKSVKEAGTYISPAYILIMVTGFLSFTAKTDSMLTYMIPIYGNVVAIKSIFLGKLGAMQHLSVILVSIVVISVIVFLIKKAFYSEKVMFSK